MKNWILLTPFMQCNSEFKAKLIELCIGKKLLNPVIHNVPQHGLCFNALSL